MPTATPHYAEPAPVIGVTLELSREEAEVLIHVLRRVGGTPESSPRGTTDAILTALRDALGVPDPWGDPLGREASEGQIFFHNDPKKA